MSNRRMFSKSITNSSGFLMMPQSSQNLYFHLGMNADDDGFCEHFTIMRMTESKPDDLKVLNAKGFIKIFDERVLVIIDWKENNYLRSDRYTPSKYLEIYKEEIKRLSSGIPEVDQRETQDRLGKVRLGKDKEEGAIQRIADKKKIDELIYSFKEVNPSYKRLFPNITQRSAMERLLKEHGKERLELFINTLSKTNSMKYAPTITTPIVLENKLGDLIAFIKKEKSQVNKIKL